MTREELKKYKLILELLEQEPCEDTISRKAAINAITKIHPVDTEYDCTLYDKLDVMYVLKDLPPVIPSRPKGAWIDDNCSICGYGVKPWNNTPYCPNCGAKMTESEK